MGFIAPLITAGAALLGFGATAAATIGSVGASLIGIGASLLVSRWLAGSAQKPVGGATSEVQFGGDVARQILFGRVATAGHLVYINSYGKSNSHEQEVYVLADVECDSLVSVIVDGKAKSLTAQSTLYDEDARYFVSGYGSKLEIRFYRGAASQTADGGLISHANPAGRWTSAHRGDGICYVVVDKQWDDDLFSGFPSFKFVVKGAKLYDPRLDTTAGGSGAHRWNDPATWAWSENPAVCVYNYQRGFERAGARFLGQGVPSVDLPVAYYMAAANVCDEEVMLLIGSEPRYVVSAIASDDAQHRDVIESCMAAMAGRLYELAGAFCPVAGAGQTVALTISDDDLILGGSVRVTRKRSRAELVNYVSGTYTSPADLWESKGFTPISSTANEVADGERLGRAVSYPQVPSQTAAERLALIAYNESRHQTAASIPLSLKHIALECGDWIRWNSARYGDRTYRLDRWQVGVTGGNLGVVLSLTEVNADIYGWTALTDQQSAIIAGSGREDGPMTTTVSGLIVSADVATSPAGETVPIIVATWTPPDDVTVSGVVIEYRRVGETVASRVRSDDPEAGSMEISGIVGGQDYEVRATITTDPPRATSWTSWQTVTTDLSVFPGTEIDVTALVPELIAQIDAATAAIEEIRRAALADALGRASDRDRATRLASDVRAVAAAYGAAAASAVSALQVYADATYATAEDLTALEASVGGIVANIGVSSVAAADQTGALARWKLRLNATDGSGPVAEGGVTYEAIDSGGTAIVQVIFETDKFIVRSTGESDKAPFAISGGKVFMDDLQIRHQLVIGSTLAGAYGGSILLVDST